MRRYDCVVLGSGIAGSTCALLLARQGLQVLVVERGTHPRFAIGESTVPNTSLGLDALAGAYGVPELRQVSHYPEMRELGLRAWPKVAFHFAHHEPGLPLDPSRQLMFPSPGLPIGPDAHMLRADVDAFLASRLPAYGVDHLDRTAVEELQPDDTGVTLALTSPAGPLQVRSRFAVDCSGHASFLAARYGLRDARPRCHTDTRALFSHYENVPWLEDVLADRRPALGLRVDGSTIHHCFDGGWIWVIRFDHGVVSVGAVLDRGVHPDDGRDGAQELDELIARFPTVREHLGNAERVRPVVKTGRIQFTSRTIVGDRFLLAPHAAAFVDPLYSTGIDLSVAFLARAVPAISRAMAEDDFRPARFRALDTTFRHEIATVDRLVHGTLRSFRHFEIFKQYWRTWVFASTLQYFTQVCYDPAGAGATLGQYGSGVPSWRRRLGRAHRTLLDVLDGDPEVGARRLAAILDEVPSPFDATDWSFGADHALQPVEGTPLLDWFRELAQQEPALRARIDLERLAAFEARLRRERERMGQLYRRSEAAGSEFHRGIDLIRFHSSPPRPVVA